jgi:hypothetical protein
MFILKIPIFGLFGIVWWAVRQRDDPHDQLPVRSTPAPHPRSRVPRPRRPRGPHSEPMPLPPARVRRVTAIGRERADR